MNFSNLKISQDGDKVCVLFGENLQEGVAGFGDTEQEAMSAFAQAYLEKQGWVMADCSYDGMEGIACQKDDMVIADLNKESALIPPALIWDKPVPSDEYF